MKPVSLLNRFSPPVVNSDQDLVDEHDGSGDYRAFGINRRAVGSELMLNVVLKDGDHHTLSYSHLYRMAFNPSQGIQLLFTDHTVHIRGERLADLHRYLRTQRVTFVAEADKPTSQTIDASLPLIRSIVVESRQEA